MAICNWKCTKLFDSLVDSLVPCSNGVSCSLANLRMPNRWSCLAPLWIASSITAISLNPFKFIKTWKESTLLKYFPITPQPSRKRTIAPDQITLQNWNPNFISKSWSLKFLWVPASRPIPFIRKWFFNLEVDSINWNQAVVSNVAYFSLLPWNLRRKKEFWMGNQEVQPIKEEDGW